MFLQSYFPRTYLDDIKTRGLVADVDENKKYIFKRNLAEDFHDPFRARARGNDNGCRDMTKFRKSTDGGRIKIKSGRANLVSSNYISLRESLFNAGGGKISCRRKKRTNGRKIRARRGKSEKEGTRRRERRREGDAGRTGREETEKRRVNGCL